MILEGKRLVKAFGGLLAVEDFDIAVRPGEVVGLIGPNGSGKTTVVNLLCGTLGLTKGKVLLDGEDITRCPAHARAQMGIIRTFQLSSLFWNLTVMKNIETAFCSRHQRAMIKETIAGHTSLMGGDWYGKALNVLEKLGIADLKDRLVTELSGGQQRMVGLAVALMADPQILLLDEPVAGLRWDAAENLLQVVKRLASDEQMGILMIEHNMKAIIEYASRVIAMSFGHRVAEGSAEEVLGSQEVIEAYLGQE
jgi:branched-chain amino acid transport system ATP-binding protein